MARVVRNLLFRSSAVPPPFKFHDLRLPGSFSFSTAASIRSKARKNKGKNLEKSSNISVINQSKLSQVKRRTRSEKELDEETFLKNYGNDTSAHVPVLLGEVLDVFTSVTLRSFLDCTLGAAGHSSAVSVSLSFTVVPPSFYNYCPFWSIWVIRRDIEVVSTYWVHGLRW